MVRVNPEKHAPGGASTPAIAALQRHGATFVVHRYHHDQHSSSYGAEAAAQLEVDPRRVLKTLMVMNSADPRSLALGIVPVSGILDLKALAQAMKIKKLVLAPVELAERTSGYVVGGISPFGQRRALPTIIDAAAQQWQTVFVSGGQRGLDLELSPKELLAVTRGRFWPIGGEKGH